ncbi:hypothetical protein BMETH_1060_0 [methanotrophic bacterial endosymbiont of Bathymodiolus sp.]|nr:hypothetical protein BMETH_1060_0 [methanotrophic bacterial endosymbiont of Bathymodiolus sp.]
MCGHIIITFVIMLIISRSFWHKSIKMTFKVCSNSGVSVFING